MEGTSITEGSTELFVPLAISEKGPGKVQGRVFFNRQMAFNRDVSVALFRSAIRPRKCLDAMAATGARGIRICNEAPGDYRFIINDRDSLACEYIPEEHRTERAGERRGLQRRPAVSSGRRDIRLHRPGPVRYADTVRSRRPCRACPGRASWPSRRRTPLRSPERIPGSAADGTWPTVRRNPFLHESGLRIMIGTIVRMAAQEDKGVTPLLCYYADHYFRLFLQDQGRRRAARTPRSSNWV